MKKKNKDYFVIGFALFAMFFGAGNLIFPPTLGRTVGSDYLKAILGFLITGVGLPLAGIISCVKSGGDFIDMANKVGRIFSIIITSALILSIGPMLAIPRTAATTLELGLQPIFPSINSFVVILLYFVINLIFTLKPSSVVDNIGKILTPVLLIMLTVIIVKGIVSPIGSINDVNYTNVFSYSLLEGYQTMDAMAAVLFTSIIVSSVRDKGYKTDSEIYSITKRSSIIAILGLSFIYGGLLYLGAQTTGLFQWDITRTQLVSEIASSVLGKFGTIALSISVILACLTTSIGLTSTGAMFFTKLTKNKIPYSVNAIIISIISMIIALNGVEAIVQMASPILQILYPVVIVLIITNLFKKYIKNNMIIAITTYSSLTFSILSTINTLAPSIILIEKILYIIPLAKLGFAWVVPTVIAFCVSCILFKDKMPQDDKDLADLEERIS